MEFILENWNIIVVALVVLAAASFCGQIANVKQWLIGAVTEAEKELGSGTGKLKLRQVYDLFIVRYPKLSKILPFWFFSKLVDTALVAMRELLEKNEKVKKYVEGVE